MSAKQYKIIQRGNNMYPDNYKYSKEHEWVSVDGDVATIGITSHAQDQLGDVVYVELPEVGDTFAAEDEFGTVESVKAVSELYTPISGEVIETNESLEDAPEQVNEDPHGDGWIIKMRVSDASELEGLMSAAEYTEFVSEED